MNLGLRGKAVVIIGGTSGIGEALAFAFAKEGCQIAVCGRSLEKIKIFIEKFNSTEFNLLAESVDVRNLTQLKQFLSHVEQKFGRIDILINNAGITIRQPFNRYTEEEFYQVVDTNMKSVYFGCVYGSEIMRRYGGGVIINTSSFTSIIPTCGSALYSATKAAVDKLTAVFAAELAADKIRVVSVQPGMTVTPLTKEKCEKQYDELVNQIAMKRLAVPEDMVGTYLFLASEYASYINGTSISITGAKLTVQNPHYSYTNKG